MSGDERVQKAAKHKLQGLVRSSTHQALALTASVKPDVASPAETPSKLTPMEKLLIERGFLPDDAMYEPFVMIHETQQNINRVLEKVAAGSEALNVQVKATADGEISRVRASVADVEEESVERMTAALEQSAQALFRGRQWRTAALVGIALCVAVGSGGAVGWVLGSRDGSASVEAVKGELAEAFRNGGEGAELWLRLMRDNDVRKSLEQCKGGAVWQANGRLACWVPLWLEEAGAPERR